MARKMRRGQKQCPACSAWVKGTRAKQCPKCNHQFNGKAAAPVAMKAVKEPRNVDAITIGQVRTVAEMVRTVGGFDRFNELLGVVREVGGLRRMKDLLEAMSAAQTSEIKA